MIRARIVNKVPRNAVNVAYVYSPPFTAKDNIALMDLSYTRPENLITRGGDIVLDITSGRVESDNISISARSILRRDNTQVIPLYYKYQLQYLLYSHTTGVVGTMAPETDIRNEVTLLDRDDKPLSGIYWDLSVVSTDGSSGYTVNIYLYRRQYFNETFKIKYHAKDGVALYPNHIEVINATPDIVLGTDFTLQEESDGFSIQGLSVANRAPGIGLFYIGTGASAVATVTTSITLPRDGGGTDAFTLAGKSIDDIVTEINEARLAAWIAVPLSDCDTADLKTGTYTVYPGGRAIPLNSYAHVKYQEEVKLQVLRPYDDPTTKPWYPRIDPGQFMQDGEISGTPVKFLFGVPEYANQSGSYTYGHPYRDIVNDSPDIIAPRMLQLHRFPVVSGSIALYASGKSVNSDIDEIDLLNGVVFLNTDAVKHYTADYSYEERSYVYDGVDLNTTALHNRDVFGKYVGIYATPYKILSGTIPQTFTTGIYHVIRDTYEEVVDAVGDVLYDDASDPLAFLLGVLRPVLTSDINEIKYVDTRVRGGGINANLDETDEPESEFYSDIGRFDGLPFQDKGSVVVGVPSNILGTGLPSIVAAIPIPTTGYMDPVGRFSTDDIVRATEEHLGAGRMAMVWQRTGLFVNPTGYIGTTTTPTGLGWTGPWGYST